jgi:23S rRNA pseudouridine2605 synthase
LAAGGALAAVCRFLAAALLRVRVVVRPSHFQVPAMLVRLQKFLADSGVASRRASEQLIVDGKVEVNGRTVRELGTKVDPASDRVRVSGAVLKPKRKLYVAVNKPRGCVCTRRDPQQRRTLGDLLPKEWGNLYSVGRLDFESEGLIFLTNDGEFCLRLTHPRYGVRKLYQVTVEGRVDMEMLKRIEHGVVDQDERLRATRTRLLEASNRRSLVQVELTEGKNREIRRLFEALGIKVIRLQRTQIGRIKLGELPVGKWRTLTETEINSLLEKL